MTLKAFLILNIYNNQWENFNYTVYDKVMIILKNISTQP